MINEETIEELPVDLSISDSFSEENDFLDLHTLPDQQEEKKAGFSSIQERALELIVSPWKWFRLLIDTFGLHFILSLFFIQHVVKGFAFGGGTAGWIGMPIYYLYRELKIPASRMQQLRAVAITPWAIKPILGILIIFIATDRSNFHFYFKGCNRISLLF